MDGYTTIDHYVCRAFKLLNTREKVEFTAFFPNEGTTQDKLAAKGVFSQNRSVVHYYMDMYAEFIRMLPRDAEQYKMMVLNAKGLSLQRIARHMIIANDNIVERVGSDKDYLNLFFEKADPRRMLEIIVSIYDRGIDDLSSLFRRVRDRDTRKMVDRLEEYGLIKRSYKKRGSRVRRVLHKTKEGLLYYEMLLKPALEFLNLRGISKKRSSAARNVANNWDHYLMKRKSRES